jgi:hypothetical protein
VKYAVVVAAALIPAMAILIGSCGISLWNDFGPNGIWSKNDLLLYNPRKVIM